MQAVCDSNCVIQLVTCRHVGSTNDIVAFGQSSLKDVCNSLFPPYHWVGDAAYISGPNMMVPFDGTNLHVTNPPKDWFNFWHSQIRITIERCFGIFVRRWGIFWRPLEYNLVHVVQIVEACCRLHNFLTKRKVPVRVGCGDPNDIWSLNDW